MQGIKHTLMTHFLLIEEIPNLKAKPKRKLSLWWESWERPRKEKNLTSSKRCSGEISNIRRLEVYNTHVCEVFTIFPHLNVLKSRFSCQQRYFCAKFYALSQVCVKLVALEISLWITIIMWSKCLKYLTEACSSP